VIFTGQYYIPAEQRVENGITGTVIDTSRDEDKVTINTRESPPRDVEVDTKEFSELSLGYAVHIYKGQGLTAETSQILTGGWQTDREHIYVAASRARERTDIYVSREDLGEQGMDPGAIERLGELMERSRAQEASITKEIAEPNIELRERDLGQVIQEQEEGEQDPERGAEHYRDNDLDLGFGIGFE
jgi:ATP-dependent exoDNAse (exonuclease V) alpha subunit